MTKKLKPLPPVGYYWVPASVDSSQSVVKIGYQPHKDFKLGIVSKKIKNRVYYKVGTPKHDMVLTMSSLKEIPQKFEKVAMPMLDLLKKVQWSLYGVPDTPKDDTRVAAKLRRKILDLTYVIQDSGGFQLATGVVDFVDPKAVAESHSRFVNSGVSLDLPGSGLSNHDLVIGSAKMLAANSKIIQENLTAPVRLLNVCHGSSLKIRHDYLKVVLQNPLDSLCIGGLRAPAAAAASEFDRTSPSVFTAHILLSMLMGEKHYQHFHVLGVSSDWQMALMALIAKTHQKVVTSDSATYKLSGFAGIHLGYGDSEAPNQRLNKDFKGWITTRCTCPVCSIIGYDQLYGRNIASVSMIHNAFALYERTQTFNAIVNEKLDAKEMTSMILASIVGAKSQTAKWKADFFNAVNLILNTTKIDQLKVLPHTPLNSIFGVRLHNHKAEKNFAEIVQRYEKYHKKKFLPA
jgi:hypothetical protein